MNDHEKPLILLHYYNYKKLHSVHILSLHWSSRRGEYDPAAPNTPEGR
jgi:hypothetical protein